MGKVIKRKILKGDSVCVISGKDNGKIGKVINVVKAIKSRGISLKVVVSDVNLCKVCKKDASGSKFISKEFPIDISNVMYFDPTNNVVGRIGIKFVDGNKVRYCKPSKKVIG